MKTQEQQLDYALGIIQGKLTEWGLDDWLGFRTPETLRLSVDGATNLLDLVNTLTGEIDRLEKIIENLDEVYGKSLSQAIFDKTAGN